MFAHYCSIVVAAFASLLPAVCRAQCQPQWLPSDGLPGVSSYVNATTMWDPDGPGPEPSRLVIGGLFTYAGRSVAKNIAMWNGSDWLPLGAGLGGFSMSYVTSLAVFQGQLFAAGWFSPTGGSSASTIARWDGSSWHILETDLFGGITCMTGYGGDLVVGGYFTSIGGVAAAGIVRWDGAAWHPLGSGVTGGQTGSVGLFVWNSDLIVGGGFISAGGIPANRIARWDGIEWHAFADGLGSTAPLSNDTVNNFMLYNNQLIASGSFIAPGGNGPNYIARWDGGAWSSLGSGLDNSCAGMTTYNGELIAGGTFLHAGAVSTNHVAAWGGNAWHAMGAGLGTNASSAVGPPVVVDGVLIAWGRFHASDGIAADSVAAWNGSSWQALTPGINGTINASLVAQGQLIVAGDFLHAGRLAVNRIAAWDGSDWHAMGTGSFTSVTALTLYNGMPLALGYFGAPPPSGAYGPAVWNGVTWQNIGPALPSGTGNAMLVHDGTLFVAGQFLLPATSYLVRWNGTAWIDAGAAFDRAVYSLAEFGGELIAGGDFTHAGAVAAHYIAGWNGSAWHPLGAGLGTAALGRAVVALTVYNQDLIAGGAFLLGASAPNRYIARWDGASWQPLGSGLNSRVSALSLDPAGRLLASGDFSAAGSTLAAHIAVWDGTSWSGLGAGIANPDNSALTVGTIGSFNGQVFAGGSFALAGGNVSANWAHWGCACYANCDNSTTPPILNVLDFVCFLNRFAAADPAANCDGSTTPPTLNVLDFTCFLNAFAAGCP